jgi:quercetin dioxygenase-like cupin family protein
MAEGLRYVSNLLAEQPQVPPDSIVSKTLHRDEHVTVILFAFDAGQELSEHTSAKPAILQILSGEADLTLGEEQQKAGPGAWAYMPAKLPHSIFAKTPVIMLLEMLES